MEPSIYLVGLNHTTAGVDVRERFALNAYLDESSWPITTAPTEHENTCFGIDESLILSTCNRVEIIAVSHNAEKPLLFTTHTKVNPQVMATDPVIAQIIHAWAKACKKQPEELFPHVYVYRGEQAVRHLFRVASSLDSMVLGEPQILGQLKEAFRKASLAKNTKAIINRLLHKAFFVAKRVRTETGVSSNAVSISYAAVELARRIFGSMQGQRALLIGAGEMAELAATHLIQAGIDTLHVINRTHERAIELAARFGGEPLEFDNLLNHLAHADIVISSTGSAEPIIHAAHMTKVLELRKHCPIFLIDIAVPRDIDPQVNSLDNIYLYDIDDLKEVVEENVNLRQDEAKKAQDIVEQEVAVFQKWLHNLALQPTLVELVRHFEDASQQELAKTLKRLGPMDADTHKALTLMARSLAHKLAHGPLTFVKQAHACKATSQISLVRKLFQLDE